MARASHGMQTAAQDTPSRILTASTGAGVAGRDMDAITPRADPAGRIPATAGIAVSIQIMAPAISVCRTAGRPGRRTRPEPARLTSPNQSAAHPNTNAWTHAATAGLTVRSWRSEPRTSPRRTRPEPGPPRPPRPQGRAAAAPLRAGGGEDRGEQPPGRQRRNHHDSWS